MQKFTRPKTEDFTKWNWTLILIWSESTDSLITVGKHKVGYSFFFFVLNLNHQMLMICLMVNLYYWKYFSMCNIQDLLCFRLFIYIYVKSATIIWLYRCAITLKTLCSVTVKRHNVNTFSVCRKSLLWFICLLLYGWVWSNFHFCWLFFIHLSLYCLCD